MSRIKSYVFIDALPNLYEAFGFCICSLSNNKHSRQNPPLPSALTLLDAEFITFYVTRLEEGAAPRRRL